MQICLVVVLVCVVLVCVVLVVLCSSATSRVQLGTRQHTTALAGRGRPGAPVMAGFGGLVCCS
jgi:hypothetical protein